MRKIKKKSSNQYSLVIGILLLLLVPIGFLFAKNQTKPQTYTASAATNQIYWSAYVPNGFQIGTNLTSFEADAGKNMSIISWYLNFTTGFPTNTMTAIRNYGSIPDLTWEPWGMTRQDIISGTKDSYITKFAQDAKTWGHPFFLRFAHEMNFGGYPWGDGANGNSKGQGEYAKMWRHVHDIFTANGATNVTWVWCPNVGSSTATYTDLYPGDTYVDWTCLDGYNWGAPTPTQTWSHWQTFSDIFKGNYQQLLSIAPTKPMMIGETSSVENGGNKAAWITDVLTTQLQNNFPQIKAFLWFNEAKTSKFAIETSPAAQQAFAAGIASSYYATNQFGNITQSPIQPPSGAVISSQPTLSLTNAPTSNPADKIFSLIICPHGFGNCGDNVSATGGNGSLLHASRNTTLTVLDGNGGFVASGSGSIVYDSTAKNFQGNITVHNLAPGSYLVLVKIANFLPKQIPGIISVTGAQTISLPQIALVTGDINNDDQIDILDYNLLISCFGSKSTAASCTNQQASDINDDGTVDGVDYNLFLRELSVQK